MNARPSTSAVIGLFLAVGTLLCYSRTLGFGFVDLDDAEYIFQNPHIASGLTWSGVTWAFSSGYANNWHPVTWLSHMLDVQFFGLNPAGHHLTNLLLHLANTLLLFSLLRQMTGAVWRCALVAALFAWHPLHVESVAWVSERKDVLSTLFFLLTLMAYRKYVIEGDTEQGAQGIRLRSLVTSRWYLLTLLLFALGLMSKPMLVTLPFVLLLLDYWPLGRVSRVQGPNSMVPNDKTNTSAAYFTPRTSTLLVEKVPFFVLAGLSSVVTYLVQRGGAFSLGQISPGMRLSNALVAYVRYLAKTFWPNNLAAIYPYAKHIPVIMVIGASLCLLALSFWFVIRSRRQPYLLVGWLWFLGTLVPTIGLVQVGFQSMADRYMYIPSIGLFILVVWGAAEFLVHMPYGQEFLKASAIAAVAACAVLTWQQSGYWRNGETLFRRALKVTEQNFAAEEGLGNALLRQGKFNEAIPWFEAALNKNPRFGLAHNNLGTALLKEGRFTEAAEHFQAAAALSPEDPEVQYNLGTAFLMEDKPAEAANFFSRALRLRADYAAAHSNLGICLMRLGNPRDGGSHFLEAVRLEPRNPESHFNLGLALLELGQADPAIKCFTEALRLKPSDANIEYFLALGLQRQGKNNESVHYAEHARDLARVNGQTQLVAKAEELLHNTGAH